MRISILEPVNFMFRSVTRILLIFSLLPLAQCSETPEEKLQRLAGWIDEGRQAEVLEEINELLTRTNNELSIPLDKKRIHRSIRRSADGSRITWLQEEEIYIRGDDENIDSIDLDETPIDYTLSFSGHYAVALLRTESACRPVALDLVEVEELEPELKEVSCNYLPAISDDGQYVYVIEDGGITPLSTELAAADDPEPPLRIKSDSFSPKYKKVTNRFFLHQIGTRGLLIFHGIGGYYNLYTYDGQGSQIKKSETDFASPGLVLVFEGDTVSGPETPDGPQPIDNPEPDNRFGMQTVRSFAYSGGAGRWNLHGLEFGDSGLKIHTGFVANIVNHMVFVRDRREFMILEDDHLWYWNPLNDRRSMLPLLARDFELYRGGLVYVDLLNRLYIRKAPFSDLEIEMVKLRERARQKQAEARPDSANDSEGEADSETGDESE
ncbi:MAG: hypothetical protein KDK30_13020 [Leptospiraceae bacterium]|nr:hypothetical protein [Leptospiraceae bacterium]